jgi:hypothetical protein
VDPPRPALAISMNPRELIARLEASPSLPAGSGERFDGYGVMGLPFVSGHVLAMRRLPASSVGPGYSSVWHRSPEGQWTFFADVPPRQSCTRFFGLAAAEAVETPVSIRWPGPLRLEVSVPAARLEWEVDLRETAATRLMNGAARLLPPGAWHHPAVLSAMGFAAGRMFRAGRVSLFGRVPNGQDFVANPYALWMIGATRVAIGGQQLGFPGPVRPQARLGDFWIPQRGIFALGRAYFEPYDPARHSPEVAGAGDGTARTI